MAWRSVRVAALLSVGLPGLGHWYLGRRVAAVIEGGIGAGLMAASLAHIGSVFLEAVSGRRSPFDILGVVYVWAPIFIVYSLLDGGLTWIVSRHRIVARTSDTIGGELRRGRSGTDARRPPRGEEDSP